MTTSQPTTTLSKPSGENRIPDGTLAYFEARHRSRVYELVLKHFIRSGLTQAVLARRLGKRPEVINRLLGAPGNWTLDTVSDLLFAISGAEPDYGLRYPLDEPARNFREPEWLVSGNTASSTFPADIVHTFQDLIKATATEANVSGPSFRRV
jgi:hypothetical protein